MNLLEETIKQIIVSSLTLRMPPDQISSDAPLFGLQQSGGLGIDSLSSLEILSALSDRFQLPLDDIEAGDFQSVATLAKYLQRKGVEVEQAQA